MCSVVNFQQNLETFPGFDSKVNWESRDTESSAFISFWERDRKKFEIRCRNDKIVGIWILVVAVKKKSLIMEKKTYVDPWGFFPKDKGKITQEYLSTLHQIHPYSICCPLPNLLVLKLSVCFQLTLTVHFKLNVTPNFAATGPIVQQTLLLHPLSSAKN